MPRPWSKHDWVRNGGKATPLAEHVWDHGLGETGNEEYFFLAPLWKLCFRSDLLSSTISCTGNYTSNWQGIRLLWLVEMKHESFLWVVEGSNILSTCSSAGSVGESELHLYSITRALVRWASVQVRKTLPWDSTLLYSESKQRQNSLSFEVANLRWGQLEDLHPVLEIYVCPHYVESLTPRTLNCVGYR